VDKAKAYREILSFLFSLLLLQSSAWAHPPAHIGLVYNQEEGNLHIELGHVTKNLRKHYIRKLFICKNDVEVKNFLYVHQATSALLVEDVSLEAVAGDVFRVKAVCRESGYKDATLVVP